MKNQEIAFGAAIVIANMWASAGHPWMAVPWLMLALIGIVAGVILK
jgi:hypothetical protein